MKQLLLILSIGFVFTSCIQSEQHFLKSKEAYFGRTPPGLIQEVFAPEIVSDRLHRAIHRKYLCPN